MSDNSPETAKNSVELAATFIKLLKQLKYTHTTEFGEGYNAAIDRIISLASPAQFPEGDAVIALRKLVSEAIGAADALTELLEIGVLNPTGNARLEKAIQRARELAKRAPRKSRAELEAEVELLEMMIHDFTAPSIIAAIAKKYPEIAKRWEKQS